MEFTHFDDNGNAYMVDVSGKNVTSREAVACGSILVSREVYDAIIGRKVKKGDVLTVAQVAGIMGAKKTGELIPMCHILNLTNAKVTFEIEEPGQKSSNAYPESNVGSEVSDLSPEQKPVTIRAFCRVKVDGKTGVEMEALTGVSIALLTIYDMCKAIDRRMVISDIHLLEKSGGKSGNFMFLNDPQVKKNTEKMI